MSHRTLLKKLFIVGLLIGLLALRIEPAAQASSEANTFHVKPGAIGGCSSWEDACGLQTALDMADSDDEIWVVQGVYTPTSSTIPEDARTVTFQLGSGVELYGGFDPDSGVDTFDERDWKVHPTVLSGDIDENDLTDPNGVVTDTVNIQGENAYHVVTGNGVDSTTILDGFIITAGNADSINIDSAGGGLYNLEGSPILTNLTFSGNSAGYGGGMFNEKGSPMLIDVNFSSNWAGDGGGMFNSWGNPTLTDVIFSGNNVGYFGGGMYNVYGSPTLTNVTFFANYTKNWGGGMFNDGSNPTLTNVTFSKNSADRGGGMYSDNSDSTLTNVTFSNNSAVVWGGGMYNIFSSPTLTNTVLWGNTASEGAQIYNDYNEYPYLFYCDIEGSYGSGMDWDGDLGSDGGGNIDANPLFVDAAGGDLRLRPFSPAIDAGDNEATGLSGINTDLDGKPRFVDIASVLDTGKGDPPIVDMGAYEKGAYEVNTVYLPLVRK